MKNYIGLIIYTALLTIAGCSEQDLPKGAGATADTLTYTVEAAPEWTALFNRNSGWFGADGIFSIPQNGKEAPGSAGQSKSFLFFSDTMIGNPTADSVLANSSMVNNTVAILQGDEPSPENIEFYWAEDAGDDPQSLFIPQTENAEESNYYWLGDGFVNAATGGDTYLFAYRMHNTGGTWGFKEVGNVLIKIPAGSQPPFNNHQQIETPFFIRAEGDSGYGSFGAGIFVNTEKAGAPKPDGYVYVYGVKNNDIKQLLAARVQPKNFENFNQWEFWSGEGWSPSIDSVEAITDRVSNELSVYPVAEGKYALIFQLNGIGSKVGMRIGETPVGPFGPIQDLWDTSEVTNQDDDYIAYNAKAHPNLSQPGELLVSFNVNSFDFFADIKQNPHLYRPRFFRIKF